MLDFQKKLTLVKSLSVAVWDAKLINFYKEESFKIWETFNELDGSGKPVRHIIEGYKVGAGKNDAIKSFIAHVLRLHLTSVGGTGYTFSKVSLEKRNKDITRSVSYLVGIPVLKFEMAFKYVCTNLLGWDNTLVELGYRYNELAGTELFKEQLKYVFEVNGLLDETKSKSIEDMSQEELLQYQQERYATLNVSAMMFTDHTIEVLETDPNYVLSEWMKSIITVNVVDEIAALEYLADLPL